MRISGTTVVLVVTLLASAAPVHAWNEVGHRVIAFLAFDRMEPAVQSHVIAILEKHPRFTEDFVGRMPDGIRNGEAFERNRWIVTQAAVWPDIARGFRGDLRTTYHRSTWHYINLPVYLNGDAEAALSGNIAANVNTEPQADEALMNIIHALKKSQAVLEDPNSSDADRATYLCWFLHLAGDLHQPMHAVALFSRGRFPQGDKGGNSVPSPRSNLHSLWDSLLGSDSKPATVERRARAIVSELSGIGEDAAKVMDVAVWKSESRELAKAHAYSPEILQVVRDGEADPEAKLPKVVLPEEYFTTAGLIARRRVLEAGYRAAQFLNDWLTRKEP